MLRSLPASQRAHKRRVRQLPAAVLLFAAISARCEAQETPVLANLSLEQLSQIQVITASKHSESVANTAAPVTVLSEDEIIRSGATNVAEALRLVPGLDLAQVNASQWAVSARGFNGRFSNKLLVMMDGRSLYTPLLAGTYWDLVSPMMEDLERIEVVKGPGSTLWGANAVNGVINILSKSARDTQGTLLFGSGGTVKQAMGGVREGFKLGDKAWMRVYAKYDQTDDSHLSDGSSGNDAWKFSQTGFRLDWDPAEASKFTLQGDAYTGKCHATTPLVTSSGLLTSYVPIELDGVNVLGRWTQGLSSDSKFTLQSYFDHTWRAGAQLKEARNTFDVDLQHDWNLDAAQVFTSGVGYRWSGDQTQGNVSGGFSPADYNFALLNIFVQDELTLVDKRLKFTIGSKGEHNSFTGTQLQPSARLLWTPTETQTFWSSISRTVRNPNRADVAADVDAIYLPATTSLPLPQLVRVRGNPDIHGEVLIAYDLGWRAQVQDNLSLDLALFYNDYDKLILGIPDVARTSVVVTPPPAHLVIPYGMLNAAKAQSYGGEFALTWHPSEAVCIAPFYGFLQVDAQKTVPGARSLATLDSSAPKHQFGLRTSFNLGRKLDWDMNLRWVDALPASAISAYCEADVRLAWMFSRHLEFSLVGQNLLHAQHKEFGPQTVEAQYELRRGVYAKMILRF